MLVATNEASPSRADDASPVVLGQPRVEEAASDGRPAAAGGTLQRQGSDISSMSSMSQRFAAGVDGMLVPLKRLADGANHRAEDAVTRSASFMRRVVSWRDQAVEVAHAAAQASEQGAKQVHDRLNPAVSEWEVAARLKFPETIAAVEKAAGDVRDAVDRGHEVTAEAVAAAAGTVGRAAEPAPAAASNC
mmetsp:Transcript_69558/g.203561  ORF Transcript_69558/g.203561 Transcript_69558/m.203561 type:complete len:190 (+) Transcript_69558:90-659(+)